MPARAHRHRLVNDLADRSPQKPTRQEGQRSRTRNKGRQNPGHRQDNWRLRSVIAPRLGGDVRTQLPGSIRAYLANWIAAQPAARADTPYELAPAIGSAAQLYGQFERESGGWWATLDSNQ